MYNFLLRKGSTIAFVVGFLISVAILVLNIQGADGISSDDFETLYGVQNFSTSAAIGVALTVAALIFMVIAGAYGLLVNPKSAIKFIIGFGILAILGLILYYGISDSNTVAVRNIMEEENISGSISKFINASIMGTLVLAGIAVVVMILGELKGLIN